MEFNSDSDKIVLEGPPTEVQQAKESFESFTEDLVLAARVFGVQYFFVILQSGKQKTTCACIHFPLYFEICACALETSKCTLLYVQDCKIIKNALLHGISNVHVPSSQGPSLLKVSSFQSVLVSGCPAY